MTGLTQYSLAKRTLTERGAIGHEKSPSPEWFADSRIHLLIKRELPPLSRVPTETVDEILFGNLVRGQLLVYADEVMDPLLGRADVSFTPIEKVIARAEALIENSSIAQAEPIYAQLDRYYFRSAGDRGREPAARLREDHRAQTRRRALAWNPQCSVSLSTPAHWPAWRSRSGYPAGPSSRPERSRRRRGYRG